MRKESVNVNIEFRPLMESDITLLYQWLNSVHVQQWYSKADVSLEVVREKYFARIQGSEPIRPYLIVSSDKPIGYIQSYRLCDYPTYEHIAATDENATGLDLFIGDVEFLHRGLGARIICEFVQKIVWDIIGAKSCWVDPDVRNHIAIRAYEKAGFYYVKTVPNTDGLSSQYLMRKDRETT